MTQELTLVSPEQALSGPESDTAVSSRSDLQVVAGRAGVDLAAAQRAAGAVLAALGIDLDRDQLRATPARTARAYAELFDPRRRPLASFPHDAGYDELVLAH